MTHKHLNSLRAYVEALDAIGEIQRIDAPVALDLEVGAIIRRSYDLRAPAPLFSNLIGYNAESGFRVLGAPAGVSRQCGLYLARVAVSLGLRPTASGRDVVEALAAARGIPGIKPRIVATGPCKENIRLGEEVDITRIPAPLLHDGDGGRFINTYGTIVARTPDGTWTNWSIARIQIIDARRMSGIVAPSQHIGRIHAMWKARGEDMPFALALGVEPAIPFVSGMPLPDWADEADYVGAYLGVPIDVVKCETNDLHVPASAEIVIEGRLSASKRVEEGPMGEYAGYQWRGESSLKPVYHVNAMTFRDEPILPVVVAGEPVEEDHTAWGIPNAAEVLHQLRAAGLPVTMVWPTLEAANHWLVVTVPMDWRVRTGFGAKALCKRIGEIVFGGHMGQGMTKIIVLEDDVDPTNTDEVVWAFATRSHPGPEGEVLFDGQTNAALSVYLADADKKTGTAQKAVLNALTRDDWTGGRTPTRTALRHGYPQALVKQVLLRWEEYGYSAEEDPAWVSAWKISPDEGAGRAAADITTKR